MTTEMPNRTPAILDEITAATESNDRNYDSNGRPVRSPKGALWKMQVMPSTARDPGFGLKPANPNDPEDMNRLGREYRAKMEEKYGGDLAKMWAAYNAGPGRVDRAIKQYGADWVRGVPQETRDYIRKNMSAVGERGVSSSGVEIGVGNPERFFRGLESALGPEAKASQNVRQTSEAIFNSDGELNRRADATEAQIIKQGEAIDVLQQVTEIAQQGATEALTRQVQDTRAISGEIVAGTEALKEKVKPVFQARGRIADQLDKLNSMSPLERGIRGIFDLNYDQDYLETQLDNYDRTLQARAADFDYLNKLHGTAIQEIERRYNMDTAVPGLLKEQAQEDLGIVNMRIQQTAGLLGNLKDRITTESQMIAAKAGAREDLLQRLDIPTVTELMTQAQENGGVVGYNGVEFSYAELRNRVQAKEQQDLSMEAYRMSIASNRMDIAEKYAVNIARSLTRGQIEAAMANGGVHEGIQLPQDVLADLYQTAVGRDEIRAADIARRMPARLALQTGSDALNQALALHKRGVGLFGNTAMEGSRSYLDRGAALTQKLIEATRQNQPPEVIATLTQQIAENTNSYQKFVEERILRSVGGDKRAAGYLSGFVYGQPLSQGTAAEAMTYFAIKGNLPEGIALSPEARQVFARAQALVQQNRNQRVNGRQISEKALQQMVTQELVKVAPAIMGQARHRQIFSDLPGVAKASQHPFGRFDATRWSEINAEASNTAAEAVAAELDTTPQNVLRMLRTGKPVENSEAGKQLLQKTQEAAGKYNAVEMQTMVRLLDLEKQVKPGTRNSTVMLDFIGSGNFATGIKTYSGSLEGQSLGEYLIGPLTQGATERNFIQTRQGIADAQAQVNQADRQLAQNPSTNLVLKPLSRTRMIMQAIPGLSKSGADALAPFVRDFYDKYSQQGGNWGIETPNSRFRREDAALYSALQEARFEDKVLENYRKLAVRGWDDAATAQQGFIERLIDGVFGESGNQYDAEVGPDGVVK